MSEDDKKENSKPVYRFDSEDALLPADDEKLEKEAKNKRMLREALKKKRNKK